MIPRINVHVCGVHVCVCVRVCVCVCLSSRERARQRVVRLIKGRRHTSRNGLHTDDGAT